MALLVVRLRYSFVLCLPLRRIAILSQVTAAHVKMELA